MNTTRALLSLTALLLPLAAGVAVVQNTTQSAVLPADVIA